MVKLRLTTPGDTYYVFPFVFFSSGSKPLKVVGMCMNQKDVVVVAILIRGYSLNYSLNDSKVTSCTL